MLWAPPRTATCSPWLVANSTALMTSAVPSHRMMKAGRLSWLAFQSLYRINALCPYCMVVWAVVLPTAWYVTLRNLEAGVLGRRFVESRPAQVLLGWHAPVLLAAFLVLLVLIGQRFWSYWSSLL